MGRWYDDHLTGSELLHIMGLRERMNRLFDEENEFADREPSAAHMGWSPAADIYDEGSSFIINMEIPGLAETDIDLEITGDTLVICGERIPNAGDKVICYHRVERPEGPFRRTFRLPSEINSGKIKAEYKDGVLTVILPKMAKPAQKVHVDIE